MIFRKPLKSFRTLAFSVTLLAAVNAFPCSRVVWEGQGKVNDIIVGRNMDWSEHTRSNLWALPRGIQQQGLAGENSLVWTSKYGSVILSMYDIGTVDGVNDQGFTASMLYLTETDFGARDVKKPGVSVSLWAQYFLDNFSTVKEAVDAMKAHPIQVATAGIDTAKGKKEGTVHLAISDKHGDSAVIEYVKGEAKVYHDKKFSVMTNSPTYDKQLSALKQFKGFGGQKALPGTTEAADRFVRAAFYTSRLPDAPANEREAIAGVLSVMRNVSQPFGESDPARPNISPTRWRTVADLTKGLYFYESTMSPYLVWVDIPKVNLAKGAPVLKVDLEAKKDLVGDVTKQFKRAKLFNFLPSDFARQTAAK